MNQSHTHNTNTSIMPESEDGRIGVKIGNLQLCARLGVGGMGAVYLAKHRVLESQYAVKVLHPRFSEDPDEVDRFRIEAIATSRLRHDNIVFVTDFGFDEQLGLYLVMEHLDGLSLLDVLYKHGALTLGRSLHIIQQVASAMNTAHSMDISHRDLKPENIVLLSNRGIRDHVKVLDFGIAALKGDESKTNVQIIGTPSYMAPEQIAGEVKEKTFLIDIYALGMLLYTMIVGRPAFQDPDLEALIKAQLWETAPLISVSIPELSNTLLEQLVAKSLSKKPHNRPQSAAEFIEALNAARIELEAKEISGISYNSQVEDIEIFDENTTILPITTSKTIRMTAVIRQIRGISPNSTAGMLLDAIPMLENLRGEALCGALWGVIQQELLTHNTESKEFQVACDQLVLLMKAVLESNEDSQMSTSQIKIFQVLRTTLPTFGDAKRTHIIGVLRSLSTHANYPHEWLSNSGSWESFKKIMTTEIHLPWARTSSSSQKSTITQPLSQEEINKMSLLEKLNQEVSFRNIGALLNHELTIFSPKNDNEE